MGEHQRRVHSTSQAQAFDMLAKVTTSSGIYVKNIGDIIKSKVADYFKYSMHEAESFRDLF